MRWEGNRRSGNVEDRRAGGGGGGMFGARGIGIGTIVIALIGGWIFGINPLTIIGMLSGGGSPVVQQQAGPAQAPALETALRTRAEHGSALVREHVGWALAQQ